MVRGPCADDRLSGVEISDDALELIVRQGQQPGGEDQEVGFLQMLEARDVVRLELGLFALLGVNRQGGIDQALLVDAEEDGAVEAVVLGKDAGQHRHRLLAAVFLFGGDQDDVFAFSRSLAAGIGQPKRAFRDRMCGHDGTKEERKKQGKRFGSHEVKGMSAH